MNLFYSRIPSAAVKPLFDGKLYAYIPHAMDHAKPAVITDYENPLMMRFNEPASFVRNGEAYVLFAKRGDALPVPAALPFGVSVIHVED